MGAAKKPQKAKGSRKTRKYGRAKNRHQAHIRYTSEKRWVKNQIAQLVKHLMKNPKDVQAKAKLASLNV